MKTGEKYSANDLINKGWSMVGNYGYHQIWKKGTEHLLWNPKTQIVSLVF